MLLSPAGTIDTSELALETNVRAMDSECDLPFPATLREIVCAAAVATVRACDDNKSAAARRLGISRTRLQRLLDGYDEEARDV
jgi:DNA-binding NtrC family response regulator